MKWVTGKHINVDRIACPWLILRFLDAEAEFLFVDEKEVLPVAARDEAVPYDVPHHPELKFTHHEKMCTFEVLLREFEVDDPGLHLLAKIVRGAGRHGERSAAPEAAGLRAISEGFRYLGISSDKSLTWGFPVYDALYAWCLEQTK